MALRLEHLCSTAGHVFLLAFGVFLVFLPELAEDVALLRPYCYFASLLPFGSFLGFFVLGLRDRRLILDVLGAEETRHA
jgi:hypothetical protein